MIEGLKGFNSGESVKNNSFLHSFEEEGTYCVISSGTPNTYCLIRVLKEASKTEMPQLVNQEANVIYKNHKIYLNCRTPSSTIHYTIDGSPPTKLSRLYDDENGVMMDEEGICFVRAIAFSDKHLTSDIFTSQRFYVIPDPAETSRSKSMKSLAVQQQYQANEAWWHCIPHIEYNPLGVGCIEITWEFADDDLIDLISHYQLYLNRVSYKQHIPVNKNKIVVKGLAGGRNYETTMMVYPKDKRLLPQQSNIVVRFSFILFLI